MAQKYIKYVPKPKAMKRISQVHIALYRATRGLVGKRVDGLDILLLTTRGRKSGLERTVPLPYFVAGDQYILMASNGGNDKHPAWFHNLKANPDVALQVGRKKLRATASTAEGDDYERLWKHVTADHPRYDRYATWTERKIPVVVLDVQS